MTSAPVHALAKATSVRGLGGLFLVALAGAGCTKDRTEALGTPTYRADVAPIVARACASCHSGATPAAGWNPTSYVGALACVTPSAKAAVLPRDATAPLVQVLDDATHRGRLSADERDVLLRWVAGGAPDIPNGIHPSGVANPRSPDFHGAQLRAKGYAPMRDGNDEGACGRCHDGVASRPPGVTLPAASAPACTTCHAEPEGVLACGTCHGDGKRAYPPRDPCFFPGDRLTHAAHLEPRSTHTTTYPCTTCHALPGPEVLGGAHANGTVEVRFDATLAGADAAFDSASGACTVACHDHGGARARPAWGEPGPMGCGDCHGAPPAAHYPGTCTTCHRQADAKGTSLAKGSFHLDGKVELGDGSGTCGACHGASADGWPATAAHLTHKTPATAVPFSCASCHPTYTDVKDPGHLDGQAHVAFGEHATDRDAAPTWDGSSCAGVACHGAKLVEPVAAPVWKDASGDAKACGACHGLPPTKDHTEASGCDRSDCHGAEVERNDGIPSITPFGRLLHVNGLIDHAVH